MKKYIKYLGLLLLFFAIYLVYDITLYKDRLYGISNVELEVGKRYTIGNNGKDRKICDAMIKYGCLEGNIKSYKILNHYIYIYYTPYKEYSTTMGNFIHGDKIYSVFGPYDNHLIFDINQIPDLIKIDNSNYGIKEFYLSSDIEKLNEQDKEIFKELMKK